MTKLFDMPAEARVTQMSWPTKIVFGAGALKELPAQVERLKMRRPLVVTDAGVVKAGLAQKLFEVLQGAKIAYEVFDKVLAMGGSTLSARDHDGLASAVRDSAGRDVESWPMTRGILRGIEDGWFMSEIAEAAFQYQTALEKGDKRVVGVNCHEESVTHDLEILRVSHEVEVEQVRALGRRRSERDQAAVDAALARMLEVARTDDNMVPAMLEACRAEATLGEICDALRAEWGEYREPVAAALDGVGRLHKGLVRKPVTLAVTPLDGGLCVRLGEQPRAKLPALPLPGELLRPLG